MAMTKNDQKSGPIIFSGETLVGWVREPQHFKFTSAAVFEPGVGVPVVTRNLDVKQRLWVDSRRPTLSKATQFLQRLILCQPCHPIQRLLTSIAKVEFTEGIFPVVNAGQADP